MTIRKGKSKSIQFISLLEKTFVAQQAEQIFNKGCKEGKKILKF